MDREKAVARCKYCIYCHMTEDGDGLKFLGCRVCANKWIVEIDECPITEGRKGDALS